MVLALKNQKDKKNPNFLFVGAILALPTNKESQQDQN
jgi:hypothetical protein